MAHLPLSVGAVVGGVVQVRYRLVGDGKEHEPAAWREYFEGVEGVAVVELVAVVAVAVVDYECVVEMCVVGGGVEGVDGVDGGGAVGGREVGRHERWTGDEVEHSDECM